MNLFRNAAVAAVLFASPAFAQKLVAINVDPGSGATVTYVDEFGTTHTRTKTDTGGDGRVEITVPDGINSVTISKYSDGEHITYKQRL